MKNDLLLRSLNCKPEEFHKQQEADAQYYFGLLKNTPMSYEEFFDSTAFFLAASSDTTTSSLAHILFLLAMNQNAQNKLYDELKSVLKTCNDHVCNDKMSQMPYLDLVIKESLRLLPLTFMLSRKVTEPLKLKKYTVPANTVVLLPIYETHIDEEIWGTDALEFKPERFKEENIKKIRPYTYMPFSSGLRICPGMNYAMISMKIFLSRFFMEYKVSTKLKYSDLKFVMELVFRTQQDPIIMIEKRI